MAEKIKLDIGDNLDLPEKVATHIVEMCRKEKEKYKDAIFECELRCGYKVGFTTVDMYSRDGVQYLEFFLGKPEWGEFKFLVVKLEDVVRIYFYDGKYVKGEKI